jgi:hypothetical protein
MWQNIFSGATMLLFEAWMQLTEWFWFGLSFGLG